MLHVRVVVITLKRIMCLRVSTQIMLLAEGKTELSKSVRIMYHLLECQLDR